MLAAFVAAGTLAASDVRLESDATFAPDATSPGGDLPAILVSRQLVNHAHLELGDVVTLAATPSGERAARFRVAGVYEPTPDPMKFAVERLEEIGRAHV